MIRNVEVTKSQVVKAAYSDHDIILTQINHIIAEKPDTFYTKKQIKSFWTDEKFAECLNIGWPYTSPQQTVSAQLQPAKFNFQISNMKLPPNLNN